MILSLLFLQYLISSTHTETCAKLWKLLLPREFDLNSSWSPDCLMLYISNSSSFFNAEDSLYYYRDREVETGRYNTGERDLWTYGLSNGFLCITYAWLGQMPGHSVFFLKTFWRVLLLITNQFLKITWHS